jgi:hypothetical protein
MAFPLLLAAGILGSGTRMVFLAFLPFIPRGKGATAPILELVSTPVFAGGDRAGPLAASATGAPRIDESASGIDREAGPPIGNGL